MRLSLGAPSLSTPRDTALAPCPLAGITDRLDTAVHDCDSRETGLASLLSRGREAINVRMLGAVWDVSHPQKLTELTVKRRGERYRSSS
jgi:hypothetical protein